MRRIRIFAGLNIFILIIIIGLSLKFTKNRTEKNLCQNCNVILISLDTLAAKHMPCYGYQKNTTPNLCKYGKENIIFRDVYSPSFWTLPSHFSIFTSLYPTTHKVIRGLTDALDPKYKTLTESLKENGYSTLYFGPTNDSALPLDKGLGSGFEYIEKNFDDINSWENGLKKLEENQKNNKKTFLFLHTYKAHYPYLPGKKEKYEFIDQDKIGSGIPITTEEYDKSDEMFLEYAKADMKKRINETTDEQSKNIDKAILENLEGNKTLSEKIDYLFQHDSTILYEQWQRNKIKTPSDLDFYTSIYDESVYNLDKFIGNFLKLIKEKGMDKNTIIVFTSDHGEGFDEHGFLTHCGNYPYCLYNEIIKVPLIISIPGIEDKEINDIVQTIDIYPTIMSYLGIEAPRYIEGLNLRDQIENKLFKKNRKYAISEHGFGQKTVVNDKWKLYIRDMNNTHNPESTLLFSMEKDIEEKVNLLRERPNTANKMIDFALSFSKRPGGEWRETAVEKLPEWLDETRKKRLLEQGYF